MRGAAKEVLKMRMIVSMLALVSMAACGGTSIPVQVAGAGFENPSSGSAAANPSASSGSGDVSFAGLLNQVRSDAGSAAVSYNAQLDTAAQSHAQDMLDNNYFSHTGRNGSTAGQRATAAGYNWRTVGENIASGYQTEASVMNGWVNSPGHQANNINPSFEEFGLGYAVNGNNTRWVLMLGAQH
jgi:uncharacterized protein YkwD